MALLIIDGYYFEKMQKNWGLIDYDKFEAFLEERIQIKLKKKFYMDSYPEPPTQDRLKFIRHLQSRGYECPTFRYKYKSVTCEECKHVTTVPVQAGVDVGLATILLENGIYGPLSGAITNIILIAGDGDFLSVVQTATKQKTVWLCSFKYSYSLQLRSIMHDQFITLDDVIPSLLRVAWNKTEVNTPPQQPNSPPIVDADQQLQQLQLQEPQQPKPQHQHQSQQQPQQLQQPPKPQHQPQQQKVLQEQLPPYKHQHPSQQQQPQTQPHSKQTQPPYSHQTQETTPFSHKRGSNFTPNSGEFTPKHKHANTYQHQPQQQTQHTTSQQTQQQQIPPYNPPMHNRPYKNKVFINPTTTAAQQPQHQHQHTTQPTTTQPATTTTTTSNTISTKPSTQTNNDIVWREMWSPEAKKYWYFTIDDSSNITWDKPDIYIASDGITIKTKNHQTSTYPPTST